MKRFLVVFLVLGICSACDSPKPCVSPMQHTGIVTIADISVGDCDYSQAEKSGSSSCDRVVEFISENHVHALRLQRSDSWPPVWKGARGDIWYWKPSWNNACEEIGSAVITEFILEKP